MPSRLDSRPSLCGNIASRMFFPCHFSSQGCRPRIGCRGECMFWGGGVDPTSFLFGFSSLEYSLIFWFCWRHGMVLQQLASRGSPVLSWFFVVAERTFGYVNTSKFNFGLWILNSSFGHLLSVLGVCSVGV